MKRNESSIAAVTRVLQSEMGVTPTGVTAMMLIDAVQATTPPPREVTIGMLSKILSSLDPSFALDDWATRSSREIVAILSKRPEVKRVADLVDNEALWCTLEGTIAGLLLRVCHGQDLEGGRS